MTDHDDFLAGLAGTVDRVHRTTPHASVPPPDLWEQVLAHASVKPKEKPPMSTATLFAPTTPPAAVEPARGGGFRHYANLAASIALALTIAIGALFAVMQLNQPDDPGSRFAVLPATPEVAQVTCDVEPMGVDEVMEIVENPYRYSLTSEAALESIPAQAMELVDAEYAEAWSFRIDSDLLNSRSQGQYDTEADFLNAVGRMNGWLDCLGTGTIAHVFRFTDPFEIQRIVLSNHPVIRDYEAIRSGVTGLLEMPAADIVRAMGNLPGQTGYSIHANENRDDALVLGEDQSMRYNASLIMQIGIKVVDEDGTIIYENTATGTRTSDDYVVQKGPFTVLMAKSAYNGEWYVLAVLPQRT